MPVISYQHLPEHPLSLPPCLVISLLFYTVFIFIRARYDDTIMSYPYCEQTDVYSYGLMLWELITLKPLFVRPKEYKGEYFTIITSIFGYSDP